MSNCKKINYRYYLPAYMTIEAAYIVPVVFICFIFTVYLTFYLFNHCIVFQSCYIAALRGQQIKNYNTSDIKQYVDENLMTLLDEQVYQYQIDYKSKVSLTNIEIESTSVIENEISNMGLWEDDFDTRQKIKLIRLDPAEYIRQNHRW